MQYVWQLVHSVSTQAGRLNRQEWMYVLVGVVAFGAFCMRGFGSRNNY